MSLQGLESPGPEGWAEVASAVSGLPVGGPPHSLVGGSPYSLVGGPSVVKPHFFPPFL